MQPTGKVDEKRTVHVYYTCNNRKRTTPLKNADGIKVASTHTHTLETFQHLSTITNEKTRGWSNYQEKDQM